MKQLNKSLSLFFAALLCLSSCASYKPADPNDSLFWKISGNGIKKPSYVYGTFHLDDKRLFAFDKVVYKRLNQCDVVTGEIQMNMASLMLAMFRHYKLLFLPSGMRLKDLYDNPDDYQIVKEYIKKNMGEAAGLADSLKPLYLTSLGAQPSEGKSNPMGGMKGTLDGHFQSYGKEKGKKIVGLETVEEQLRAVDAISLKDQAKMLLESAQSSDEGSEDETMDAFIELYRSQDLEILDSIINGSGSETFKDELLTKRNITMSNRIDKLVKEKPTFNTFGAGHLYGEKGIINLLKQKGYTVSPIYFEFD